MFGFDIGKEWKATAVLVGTTIGAGMFGLPYVFSRLGFFPAVIYLVLLTGVMVLLNLLYGEVVLRTPGDHQITGYLRAYFGKDMLFLNILNSFSFFISAYGALLAYSTKTGEFLQMLLGVGTPTLYTVAFYVLGSVALYFGLRSVSVVEMGIVLLIFLSILLFAMGGVGKMDWEYLKGFHLPYIFLPYGVILFALNGSSVIPEVEEVLRDDRGKVKKAILMGTLIPASVYLLFSLLVVGSSGPFTSQDALSGMIPVLPVWMVKVGAVVGILAMSSSFLSFGFVLRESWFRDFKVSRGLSFLLSILPPFLLFVLGVRGFINILEFSGAVSVGLTSFLILTMHQKAKREGKNDSPYSIFLSKPVYILLKLVFLVGAFTPLIQSFL